MTLLASERSLLIRNKFRTVLQLRIQNRRLSEINADSGLKSNSSQKTEKKQKEAQCLTEDGGSQKLPPGGLNPETAQERTVCGAQRQRRNRQTQDLSEKIRGPPATAEQQPGHALPPENCPVSFSADVFEEDMSSSSVSDHRSTHQSVPVSSLPVLPADQSLSDCSAVGLTLNQSPSHAQSSLTLLPATVGIRQPLSVTLGESNSMASTGRQNGMYPTSQTTPLLPKTARPSSPTCSSLPPPLNFNHLPRPRKPRDIKPKMRKLKYHQYIPPDQRGASGTGVGGAKQQSPTTPTQSLDPAYSHLLTQQQVFLQLQILQSQQQQQQQQQLTVVPSGDHNDLAKTCSATPLSLQPAPASTNQRSVDTNHASKPELLPANLVDLTVSELRQQLRKRGLPVSGTKPALLQRLRPFQLLPSCPTPTPLCKLGTSPEPLTPCPSLPPSQSPGSSLGSGLDSPSSSPNQQLYIQDGVVPNGILCDAPSRDPTGTLSAVPNGYTNAASVSLAGEQCRLTSAVFLAPASTASGLPSPSLPVSSSSPLQCGTPWKTEREQLQQQQELSVELQMRGRKRSRPSHSTMHVGNESSEGSLHPFLQQDPMCFKGKPDINAQVLLTQPCDVIGHDFELPLQITASPGQTSPGIRSLEEELQEAIQKAQMDPRQSIDDILNEPITCDGSLNVSDHKSPAHSAPDPSSSSSSSSSQTEHFQSFQQQDDNFLPSPLCSSLLLELPPSPAKINPSQVVPAPPPPPPICISPPPSMRKSRKRRSAMQFDAADWLETLTSGLYPLTPPKAAFVESDFSLDSDLNVNRVLDLLVEQW
ncbi:myocardin [Austrofundulus limnaeus]|uniref:Myocardin-like n=1 Tax=Austrofundulus limnaeus TaxID=52670 RepID=A0A2I4BK70_AUSLI|nr:PREDICTED: myocardin-like [Austrofundulus limnaeus]XP_013868132.1 PREDICTED: myocardin-like [Austrofundulus limnaeus]XP_013868133.1 PREDICTED: myocardin-like [Austrofundulus limnaeus]